MYLVSRYSNSTGCLHVIHASPFVFFVVVTELSGVVTVVVDSQKVLGADAYQASLIRFPANTYTFMK